MTSEEGKRLAGEAAALEVRTGQVIGLGTGSTAAFFIRALAERVKAEGLKVKAVPTSKAAAALGEQGGLTLFSLDQVGSIDLTVDGADEIGPGLALIKGGGAALLGEKLVWEASKRVIVIADAGKKVDVLGAFPLPIEVVAFGHRSTANRITDVLSEYEISEPPSLRMRGDQPLLTDHGHYIYDARCRSIFEPAALGSALKSLTGVVEHGLFLDLAEEALVGGPAGVERLEP